MLPSVKHKSKKAPVSLFVTQRSYSTDVLPRDAFLALDHYDEWLEGRGLKTLMNRLKALRCISVEWNGHFGPHIFFSLDVADDTESRRRRIGATIAAFLTRAVRWQAKMGGR